MPNPGAMTSLQTFDRETINTVVHVPDYKIRHRLSQQQKEGLVVEAFVAFDEMFYLHLRWADGSNFPEVLLSSVGARYHKLILDLNVQSPHFTYSTGDLVVAAPQWSPCTWSTPSRLVEVQRPSSLVPLQVDKSPTYHNDVNISLEQTVTFTLTGTIWELDDSPTCSLHCKSYRARTRESSLSSAVTDKTAAGMISNVAATRFAPDVATDLQIVLVEECGTTSEQDSERQRVTCDLVDSEAVSPVSSSDARRAHSFLLQAQSPVFRRMLAAPMLEASERTIKMSGVTSQQLDDLLQAVYRFGVPPEVQDSEDRLLGLLALADRYELLELRYECAALLEMRLSEANMATLLQVADLHQATELRTTALEFITARIERIASVMDTDNPNVRKNVREYLSTSESFYKAHTAAGELKTQEVTLTV